MVTGRGSSTFAACALMFTIVGVSLASVSDDSQPVLVKFDVVLSKEGREVKDGSFVVEVHPEWAPLGAKRFLELVEADFWATCRFFRVVPGFVVQWGIHGKPSVSNEWRTKTIKDDPQLPSVSNLPMYITFAKSGPDTRTSQVFINYGDNAGSLDSQGFPPFGKVIEGEDVVRGINSEYAEQPNQGQIQSAGNAYLRKEFPRLSYIKKAYVVQPEARELVKEF